MIERKRIEERLRHIAYRDDLTGIRSRSYFIDALEAALTRAAKEPRYRFALLFIDLDRFKLVNDSLGHRSGDLLLVEFAERLRASTRIVDTLARMGGDEFTILLDDIDDIGEAVGTAERIGKSLEDSFLLGGHEVFGSASVGIADSSAGYADAAGMLRCADSAMYAAKRHNGGRGGYAIYEEAMDAKAPAALALQQDLRKAVERQEFCLHYQPIVRLDTQRVVGFEALVRWQHPLRGLVSPAEFIALAEQTGLIVDLGAWVLREACLQMRSWLDRYGSGRLNVMSVNLSSRQMSEPSFARDLAVILDETGIDRACLQLEVTESVLLDNVEAVGGILADLRRQGIAIAIDDFGTGYSSLSYLQRYRVDTLKIDQSFVRGIEDSPSNVEIIRAVVALAKALKIKVNAEGVETARQLYAVAALGCTTAQGYYFSRAIAASDVPAFLASEDGAADSFASGSRLEYAAL
ncbi:MAG: bifunctional diguanylate cyclase/phosphodiesterase [Candidatus Eremiobacteraeota bacterium]|nr:bifunctional diguanylate cyclase/phosphodiesterase [Candidatus Eremiobacteraeota bacterium]